MTDPGVRPPALRVLIICTHFPPTNATGARRPYYLARQLARRGHRVTVLTSTPEGSDRWEADLEGIRVIRKERQHLQRDLNGPQRWLAKLHHRTRGTRWNGPLRVAADLLLPLEHAVRWDIRMEELDHLAGPQDIVVATGPGWSTAEFGLQAAGHWNALLNLDYRDPWSVRDPHVAMDIVTYQGAGIAGMLRRWHMHRTERRILASVDLITATSEAFARNAARSAPQGTSAMAFPGGFDSDLGPSPRLRSAHFTITYTGRLYPEQDWGMLFDAVRMLNTSRPDLAGRLRIRFVGPVSTDAALIQQVHAQAARNTCIITVPRCSRHEAIALQHDSDAVLHLTYRGRRGYLPVKFLEYLGAGRPLIMISAEQEEAEAMLRESGTGVQVRDAQELVRLLIARLEHHAQGNTWELPVDPSVLRNFSYPVRMEVWVKELEKRMESRRAGSRA